MSDYDYDYDDDYDDCYQLEEDLSKCGWDGEDDSICHEIGTEYCSFFCPFRHGKSPRVEEPS